MDDLEDTRTWSESYPTPPPFYKLHTEENLKRLQESQHSGQTVSSELRCLLPPPPPTNGRYRSFAGQYDLYEPLVQLEDLHIERLYPAEPDSTASQGNTGIQSQWTYDRAFHLQRIVRSILLNFLELVGNLSQDAPQAVEKTKDLENLFVNAFNIINEFRPHQARETLILLMEEQVKRRRNEMDSMKALRERVDAMASALPLPESKAANGTRKMALVNGHGHLVPVEQQLWSEFDD